MPRKRADQRHPSGLLNPSGFPNSWEVAPGWTKHCKECGQKFIKYGGRRPRLFCLDACRKAANRRSHDKAVMTDKEPFIRDNEPNERGEWETNCNGR